MDYYIVVNGRKEGPYDVLSLIKKVKNGTVTPQTQVSAEENGPYRPAAEVEELKSIIKAEIGQRAEMSQSTKIDINILMNESAELWIKRVVEYTLFFGFIIMAGLGIGMMLGNIQILADYPFITNYIVSVVIFTMYGFYCYYVLSTKRSQDPDLKEIKSLVKFSVLPLFIFSAIMSSATILVGFSPIISLIALMIVAVILSFLIFVPFLITDHKMGLKRSVKGSIEGFRALDISIKAVILVVVVINIAAIVVPGLINSYILLLGLIVILPISVAIFSYIYDHILA